MICDVLFLTASFGNGHNAVTHALSERFREHMPSANICACDIIEMTTPVLKKPLSTSYEYLTRLRLPIYNSFYKIRNRKDHNVDNLLVQAFYHQFEKLVMAMEPAVIVSVFPTSSRFASIYKQTFAPTVKTVTVITDVVANWEWIHADTDLYCVPAGEIRDGLIKMGVSAEQILITGVPVSKNFNSRNQDHYIQTNFVQEHDFHANDKKHRHVLIMASAVGKLQITQKTLYQLGCLPYAITLVAGTNEAFLAKLQHMHVPENVKVLGFTDRISELMHQSDLVVTKPGGATVFEAIQCQVPMLIMASNIAQESCNIDFIKAHGLGDTIESSKDLGVKIDAMMADVSELADMSQRMALLKSDFELTTALDMIKTWVSQKKL